MHTSNERLNAKMEATIGNPNVLDSPESHNAPIICPFQLLPDLISSFAFTSPSDEKTTLEAGGRHMGPPLAGWCGTSPLTLNYTIRM